MPHSPANPWHALPHQPDYILPEDAPFVREFNHYAHPHERLALDVLPEPFFGRRDAPVVILLLNPGLGEADAAHHTDPAFAQALRADITSDAPRTHFHLTDPTRGPGYQWWQRACRDLINAIDISSIAQNILSIEYAPYHSECFTHSHVRFPSQAFSFSLVRTAMERRALIVCMRGDKLWRGAVPELGEYPLLIKPRNPRTSALSHGNLEEADFALLLTKLRDTTSA